MAQKEEKSVWVKNFAGNKDLADRVLQLFGTKMKSIQDQRYEYEQELIRYYNMWNVAHDDNHTYSGNSKLYIPEVRKNVEAQARTLTDTAFPNDEFFDCVPGQGGTYAGAQIQNAIRKWQMEQANITTKYFVYNRQKCLYGTSPVRISWKKQTEYAFANARDKKTGKLKMTKKLIELYNGPDFQVRDLMKWYPLNNKKIDFREDGCFENQMVDKEFIELLNKKGMVFKKDEIFLENSEDTIEELNRDIQRAETLGLSIERDVGYGGTANLRKDTEDKMGKALMQVIFAKVVGPKEMYLDDEDTELPIPMEIHIYNNRHVGFIGRNSYWHQLPPYVVGRYLYPNADEFYGQGIPKATQYQQYELNSKAEQCMDSVTMALNPIAIIDPAFAAQNADFEIEPAAIWFANPQGVKLASLPDVSATGYQAIGQLRSQIQDYSDRAPALPAQFQGKSRTATQSEIIDRSMSVDSRQFQRQDEKEVLEPMLEMWESLTDQYADESQMIMILGRDAGAWGRQAVTKEMYLGNYKYFWKVTTDLSNRQIKSRQMIDMMKVAGSLPPEAQAKLNFNFAEAYRILWKDINNLPGAEKVIPDPFSTPKQDPRLVLEMLRLGMETEVLPGDDNVAFIKYMTLAASEEKDKDVKKEIMRQIYLHMESYKVKQATLQQEMQRRQEMMMAQQEAQGGSGTQGSGNRTQLSPNAGTGDMASGTRA